METPSQGSRRKRRRDCELDETELARRRSEEKYREQNREKIRQRMRDWRAANRDKIKGYSKRFKEAVYAAYGGYICKCCGETEPMFLSIDHIENNGAAERRSGVYRGGGSAFYAWLKKQGFPPGYQVLCMNCQVGKHKNKGVCPHRSRCND